MACRTSSRPNLEYLWRLTLDDGSVVEQYDQAGDEVLFGSVDLSRVREASWVPKRCLIGGFANSATSFTVALEPGQVPIVLRRHQVNAQGDRVIFYLLGYREGDAEHVMFIAPGTGALLAQGSTTRVRIESDRVIAV